MQNLQNIIEFIPSSKYISSLKEELSQTFKSIKIYCFKIMAQGPFGEIAEELIQAAKKGADISIQADAIYSKYNVDGGNFYYPLSGKGKKINQEAINENLKLFDRMIKSGIHISYFNEPDFLERNLPFIRRDHRKVFIIQRDLGSIAYFGAINFGIEDANDFMIKVTDHKLAEEIVKFSSLEFLKSQKTDFTYEYSNNLKLILDIGKHFQSKIQKNAYEMILKAKKEIIFVSQIPAEIPLLLRFIAGRINGATVKIILPQKQYKNIKGFPFIFFFIMNMIIAKIFGMKISHCKNGYTHAKILICDDQVLLGSHNLSTAGIAFGTVELSAIIKDKYLLNQIIRFIHNLEGNSEKVLIGKDFIYNELKNKK